MKILNSSLDALDRLYRPECGGFLATVSNDSFQKGQILIKNRFREFAVFKNRPPGHVLGWFLYQTYSNNHN